MGGLMIKSFQGRGGGTGGWGGWGGGLKSPYRGKLKGRG